MACTPEGPGGKRQVEDLYLGPAGGVLGFLEPRPGDAIAGSAGALLDHDPYILTHLRDHRGDFGPGLCAILIVSALSLLGKAGARRAAA